MDDTHIMNETPRDYGEDYSELDDGENEGQILRRRGDDGITSEDRQVHVGDFLPFQQTKGLAEEDVCLGRNSLQAHLWGQKKIHDVVRGTDDHRRRFMLSNMKLRSILQHFSYATDLDSVDKKDYNYFCVRDAHRRCPENVTNAGNDRDGSSSTRNRIELASGSCEIPMISKNTGSNKTLNEVALAGNITAKDNDGFSTDYSTLDLSGEDELECEVRELVGSMGVEEKQSVTYNIGLILRDPHLLLLFHCYCFENGDPALIFRDLLPTIAPTWNVEDAKAFVQVLAALPMSRSRCGQVWEGDHVAYRCLTCGASQSSCICVNCFQEGCHEGHSYFVYRSGCGGCCDCGDRSAWKSSGFCKNHPGCSAFANPSSALPQHTRFVLTSLFRVAARSLLLLFLKRNSKGARLLCSEIIEACDIHEGIRRILGVVMLESIQGGDGVSSAKLFDSFAFGDTLSLRERLAINPRYYLYPGMGQLIDIQILSAPPTHRFSLVKSSEISDIVLAPLMAEAVAALGAFAIETLKTIDAHSSGVDPSAAPFQDENQDIVFRSAVSSQDSENKWASTARGEDWDDVDSNWNEERSLGIFCPSELSYLQSIKFVSRHNDNKNGMKNDNVSSEKPVQNEVVDNGTAICAVLLGQGTGGPQPTHAALTTVWLALMFDEWFKQKFAFVFMAQYSQLVENGDACLDRVTVQVLSIRSLLQQLLEQNILLPSLFSCKNVLMRALKSGGAPPRCIDVGCSILSNRPFMSHLSDIRYLVAEKDLLINYLSASQMNIRAFWGQGFIPLFLMNQQLNMHKKKVDEHVQYEDHSGWSNALCLSIELGQNALVLRELLPLLPWRVAERLIRDVISRLVAWIQADCERNMLETGSLSLTTPGRGLTKLLNQIHDTRNRLRSPLQPLEYFGGEDIDFRLSKDGGSLHYPLHRLFLCLLAGAVQHPSRPHRRIVDLLQGFGLTENLRPWIFDHPIRCVAFCHQITAGIWRRNGSALLNEALCYRRAFYHSLTMDVDLSCVRILVCSVPPQLSILLLISRFELPWDLAITGEGKLTKGESGMTALLSMLSEDDADMTETYRAEVHSFLLLLLQLLSPVNSLFSSSEEVLKYVLRHQLMSGPESHSSLQDVLCHDRKSPEQHTQLVDNILNEISTYKGADGVASGRFELRLSEWKHYDPSVPFFSWAESQAVEANFLEQVQQQRQHQDPPPLLREWLPPSDGGPPPEAYCHGFYEFGLSSSLRSVAFLMLLQQLLLQQQDTRYGHLLLAFLLRLIDVDLRSQKHLSAEELHDIQANDRSLDAMREFLRVNPKISEVLKGNMGDDASYSDVTASSDDDLLNKLEEIVVVCLDTCEILNVSRWVGTSLCSLLLRQFQVRHTWTGMAFSKNDVMLGEDAFKREVFVPTLDSRRVPMSFCSRIIRSRLCGNFLMGMPGCYETSVSETVGSEYGEYGNHRECEETIDFDASADDGRGSPLLKSQDAIRIKNTTLHNHKEDAPKSLISTKYDEDCIKAEEDNYDMFCRRLFSAWPLNVDRVAQLFESIPLETVPNDSPDLAIDSNGNILSISPSFKHKLWENGRNYGDSSVGSTVVPLEDPLAISMRTYQQKWQEEARGATQFVVGEEATKPAPLASTGSRWSVSGSLLHAGSDRNSDRAAILSRLGKSAMNEIAVPVYPIDLVGFTNNGRRELECLCSGMSDLMERSDSINHNSAEYVSTGSRVSCRGAASEQSERGNSYLRVIPWGGIRNRFFGGQRTTRAESDGPGSDVKSGSVREGEDSVIHGNSEGCQDMESQGYGKSGALQSCFSEVHSTYDNGGRDFETARESDTEFTSSDETLCSRIMVTSGGNLKADEAVVCPQVFRGHACGVREIPLSGCAAEIPLIGNAQADNASDLLQVAPNHFPFVIRFSLIQILYGMRQSRRHEALWQQIDWVLAAASNYDRIRAVLQKWKDTAVDVQTAVTAANFESTAETVTATDVGPNGHFCVQHPNSQVTAGNELSKDDATKDEKVAVDEEPKEKTKERQERLLAMFEKQQQSFVESNLHYFKEAETSAKRDLPCCVSCQVEDGADSFGFSGSIGEAVIAAEKRTISPFCSRSLKSSPLGLLAFVQYSAISQSPRFTLPPFIIPSPWRSPSISSTAARGAATSHSKGDVSKSSFCGSSGDGLGVQCMADIPSSWLQSYNYSLEPMLLSPAASSGGLCVRTCGHRMHASCYQRYLSSFDLGLYRGNFVPCPYCGQACNILLPDVQPPSLAKLEVYCLKQQQPDCEQHKDDVLDDIRRRHQFDEFNVSPNNANGTRATGFWPAKWALRGVPNPLKGCVDAQTLTDNWKWTDLLKQMKERCELLQKQNGDIKRRLGIPITALHIQGLKGWAGNEILNLCKAVANYLPIKACLPLLTVKSKERNNSLFPCIPIELIRGAIEATDHLHFSSRVVDGSSTSYEINLFASEEDADRGRMEPAAFARALEWQFRADLRGRNRAKIASSGKDDVEKAVHQLATVSALVSGTLEAWEQWDRSGHSEGNFCGSVSDGNFEALHSCFAVYMHLADELRNCGVKGSGLAAFEIYLHDAELLALYGCGLFPPPGDNEVNVKTSVNPFRSADNTVKSSLSKDKSDTGKNERHMNYGDYIGWNCVTPLDNDRVDMAWANRMHIPSVRFSLLTRIIMCLQADAIQQMASRVKDEGPHFYQIHAKKTNDQSAFSQSDFELAIISSSSPEPRSDSSLPNQSNHRCAAEVPDVGSYDASSNRSASLEVLGRRSGRLWDGHPQQRLDTICMYIRLFFLMEVFCILWPWWAMLGSPNSDEGNGDHVTSSERFSSDAAASPSEAFWKYLSVLGKESVAKSTAWAEKIFERGFCREDSRQKGHKDLRGSCYRRDGRDGQSNGLISDVKRRRFYGRVFGSGCEQSSIKDSVTETIEVQPHAAGENERFGRRETLEEQSDFEGEGSALYTPETGSSLDDDFEDLLQCRHPSDSELIGRQVRNEVEGVPADSVLRISMEESASGEDDSNVFLDCEKGQLRFSCSDHCDSEISSKDIRSCDNRLRNMEGTAKILVEAIQEGKSGVSTCQHTTGREADEVEARMRKCNNVNTQFDCTKWVERWESQTLSWDRTLVSSDRGSLDSMGLSRMVFPVPRISQLVGGAFLKLRRCTSAFNRLNSKSRDVTSGDNLLPGSSVSDDPQITTENLNSVSLKNLEMNKSNRNNNSDIKDISREDSSDISDIWSQQLACYMRRLYDAQKHMMMKYEKHSTEEAPSTSSDITWEDIQVFNPSVLLKISSPFPLLGGWRQLRSTNARTPLDGCLDDNPSGRGRSQRNFAKFTVNNSIISSDDEFISDKACQEYLTKIVEAGLIPWLRKLHLLLKVINPKHGIPFDTAQMFEKFTTASPEDAPSVPLLLNHFGNSVKEMGEDKESNRESITSLLSSLTLDDPEQTCSVLLEGLPLPNSISEFLWGPEDHEDTTLDDLTENQKDGAAAMDCLRQIQAIRAIAAAPPPGDGSNGLLPVFVGTEHVHRRLLSSFWIVYNAHKERLMNESASTFPKSSRVSVRSSKFEIPNTSSDHQGSCFNVGGSSSFNGDLKSSKEKNILLAEQAVLSNLAYFNPLTRRFLPGAFSEFLSMTLMKPILLSLYVDEEDEKPQGALFVLVFTDHPTVIPSVYQQFYNHFLPKQVFSPPKSILHASSFCCVCLGCGALLCARSCCHFQLKSSTRGTYVLTVIRGHSLVCGAGVLALVQLPVSSVVVFAAEPLADRGAKWGFIHLDEYGEEDLQLKRGKPLRMSAPRMGKLCKDMQRLHLRSLLRLTWVSWQSLMPIMNHIHF